MSGIKTNINRLKDLTFFLDKLNFDKLEFPIVSISDDCNDVSIHWREKDRYKLIIDFNGNNTINYYGKINNDKCYGDDVIMRNCNCLIIPSKVNEILEYIAGIK